MWRVPRYWNYALRIGPGPALLTIDGTTVLTVPAGSDLRSADLALAQGDHFVEYDGTLVGPRHNAVLEWAPAPRPGRAQPLDWQPIPLARLRAAWRGRTACSAW